MSVPNKEMGYLREKYLGLDCHHCKIFQLEEDGFPVDEQAVFICNGAHGSLKQ